MAWPPVQSKVKGLPAVNGSFYKNESRISNVALPHYFPDGLRNLQDNFLAALCLGANGIWGNLQELSREDKEYFAEGIRRYKRVAGAVCFFTCNAGTFRYRTAALPALNSLAVRGADDFRILSEGDLELTVELPQDGAGMIVICRK